MNKLQLKKLRKQFSSGVFERDNFKCVMCGHAAVDAHHITDRAEMPNNGYAIENGISVCCKCHQKAELFHQTNGLVWIPDFDPNSLYSRIGSSFVDAIEASRRLSQEKI